MSTAKMMAQLGWNGKDFVTGVDGAKRKVDGFAGNFKQVKTAIAAGFATTALFHFAKALEDIKKYQEDTGIKLVSDQELKNLESAASLIEGIKIKLETMVVSWAGKFIGGIKAAASYLGARSGGATKSEAWGIAGSAIEEGKTAAQMKKDKAAAKELADQKKKDEEEYQNFQKEGQEQWLQREQAKYEQALEDKKKAEEEAIKHKKELDEEFTKDYEKDQKTVAETMRRINELNNPGMTQVSVAPSSAARQGMFLGGKDRSGVGIEARKMMLDTKRNELLEEMIRTITGDY